MSFAFPLEQVPVVKDPKNRNNSTPAHSWFNWAMTQVPSWQDSTYGIVTNRMNTRSLNGGNRMSQYWSGRPVKIELGGTDRQTRVNSFSELGYDISRMIFQDPEIIQYNTGSHFNEHKDRLRDFNYTRYEQIGTMLVVAYKPGTVGGDLVIVEEDHASAYENQYWERKREDDADKWMWNEYDRLEDEGLTDEEIDEKMKDATPPEFDYPKPKPVDRQERVLTSSLGNDTEYKYYCAFIAFGDTHKITELKSGHRFVFKQTILYPRTDVSDTSDTSGASDTFDTSELQWTSFNWDRQLQKSYTRMIQEQEQQTTQHLSRGQPSAFKLMNDLIEDNERVKWIQVLYTSLHGDPPSDNSREKYMKKFLKFKEWYIFQIINNGEYLCD